MTQETTLHVQKGSRCSNNQTHPTDDVGYISLNQLRVGGGGNLFTDQTQAAHIQRIYY